MVGIGDGEGDLGLLCAWHGVILADADDRNVGLCDERHLLLMSWTVARRSSSSGMNGRKPK
jgi:hypothetical protein